MAAISPASASFWKSRKRGRRRCGSSAKSISRRRLSSPPSRWIQTEYCTFRFAVQKCRGTAAALACETVLPDAGAQGRKASSAAVRTPPAPAVAACFNDAARHAGRQTEQQKRQNETTHGDPFVYGESPLLR